LQKTGASRVLNRAIAHYIEANIQDDIRLDVCNCGTL